MITRFLLPVLFLAILFTRSEAAFVLLDDFETFTPVPQALDNGDNGWVVGGAADTENREYNVVDASGSNVLEAFSDDDDASGHLGASKSLSLANESTGTIYMEFQANSGTPDLTFGALTGSVGSSTDISPETATRLRLNGLNLQVDTNTGSSSTWTTVGAIEDGTWYSLWMVVDNSANNWSVYLQGGSGAYVTQTELGTGSYGFESSATGGSAPMTYFGIRMNNSHSGADSVLFDNLYVDTSGENLSVIPEPSSLVLLGVALSVLGVAGYRKRNG